ncbi:hypothetical protein Tco_0497118, partial [Tanacetum coccineum]
YKVRINTLVGDVAIRPWSILDQYCMHIWIMIYDLDFNAIAGRAKAPRAASKTSKSTTPEAPMMYEPRSRKLGVFAEGNASTLMGAISTIASSTWTCFLNAVNLDQQLLVPWASENHEK